MCLRPVLFYSDKMRHSHFKGFKTINFKITDKVLDNEVEDAMLNIYVQELETYRNSSLGPEEFFTINFQVSRITRNNQGSKASVPYTDKSLKLSKLMLSQGTWVKLNISNMVKEFVSLPREFLSIIVKVQDLTHRTNKLNLMVPHPSSDLNLSMKPYVEVFLQDNSHKRTRRTLVMDCTESAKEPRCCRYPLVVDFEEFGWDWVISPKQYDANYCSGECPFSYMQKYPHTHIAHLAAPPGGGPCCVPRKMSSISMLYFDNDLNIIYSTIQGMVVESCGCS